MAAPGSGPVCWLLLLPLALSQQDVLPFPKPDVQTWSVVFDSNGRASLARGGPTEVPSAVAWGSFADLIGDTGLAVLDLHGVPGAADGSHLSFAVGFLEGALTQRRMAQHLHNMWSLDFAGREVGDMPEAAKEFLESNLAWMLYAGASKEPNEPYWKAASYLVDQLRGLAAGYNSAKDPQERRLGPADALLFSVIDADMDDVQKALKADNGTLPASLVFPAPRARNARHNGHCSALVQLAKGGRDLWTGHATWDDYQMMLRVAKYVDLPLPGVPARRMAFTSNPGSLYSSDDFYVTDQGLTVMETSIANHNEALWKQVVPESMLTWARALLANRLARSGEEWTELQVRHQSGTCNNQWMVVDYKRFTPGKALKNGTLWISETTPGLSKRKDVTDVLRAQGSWPSYNLPYFPEIQQRSGYTEMQQAHPHGADEYSYDKSVRAQLFARAREQGLPENLAAFRSLLRENDPGDPLAGGDACNSISARCDLNNHAAETYDCFGAIDAKVAWWRPDLQDLAFQAVMAPTHNTPTGASFAWALQNQSVDGCLWSQHLGHPDVFDFEWHELPSAWAAAPGFGAAVPGPLHTVGQLATLLPDGKLPQELTPGVGVVFFLAAAACSLAPFLARSLRRGREVSCLCGDGYVAMGA